MMKRTDIIVTTTNNFEGYSITKYLKPISAHVVTGTNFFSDLFAAFSDVFGGRSKTYQNQLASIYAESIETLKNAAIELGANGIVGMKVDLDEISGKGKSMFMITAIGTAVIVDMKNTDLPVISHNDIMSIEKMNVLRKKTKIIQSFAKNKFSLKVDIWDFITKNSVHEIAEEICKIMFNPISMENTYEWSEKQLMLYFLSLDTDFVTCLFYEICMSDQYENQKLIYKIMKDLMIYDFDKIEYYLQSDNAEYRRKAIQVAVFDKQTFSSEDVPRYERLIQMIEANIIETCTYSTEKKFMSSKGKDVWICQCQNKNDIDDEYCGICGKDKFGFKDGDVKPVTAIKILKDNVEMIKINTQ
jgi:uncharacterized protein YbjQ (UPF0145 family)